MTVDEVVAKNVRRLREKAKLPKSELAERLGVSRHLAYDMERKREGRDQRHFSWEDIIRLCGALEVTVPELVLPPMDSSVEIPEEARGRWPLGGIGGQVDGTWTLFLTGGEFSALLFGSVVDGKQAERFDQWTVERRRKNAELRRLLQDMLAEYEDEPGR